MASSSVVPPNTGTHISVSSIRPNEVNAVARVYARAFAENPCYIGLFPGLQDEDGSYQRPLTWLFSKRLTIYLELGFPCLKATDADGRVVGACCAVPPGVNPLVDITVKIKHGILSWPCVWGLTSFRALLDIESKLVSQPNLWQVSMMAVDVDQQGKGVGSRILDEVIRVIYSKHAADKRSPVITLNTQKEVNVTFYRKAGFKVDEELELSIFGSESRVFKSWTMTLH